MKTILSLIALLAASPALADPPADFDARVEALRTATGIPGMSVVIVEQGKTTLAHGYGVRELGSRETVDADTIFPTGSTGKAFTVAALATLVEDSPLWRQRLVRLPSAAQSRRKKSKYYLMSQIALWS